VKPLSGITVSVAVVVITALVVDVGPAVAQTNVVTPAPETRHVFAQFAEVFDLLEKNYIEPRQLESREHATRALREFVRSLDRDADLLTAGQIATNAEAGSVAPDLRIKYLNNAIAYCRIAAFTHPVVEQLHGLVKRAGGEKTRGMILDLRNNPGGTFDATLVAAKLFLPSKAEIVSLNYANPVFTTTFVNDVPGKFTKPIVILVNASTAAEAEIFAAALRDNKAARLVGATTAGHGVLIGKFPLSDGSVLSVPTAQYLPPSKQPFHRTGVKPDVVVELKPEDESRLAAAGFGSFNWMDDRREILQTDLPLARALELLAKSDSMPADESKARR
jgi:hypothetical protein